MKTDMVALQRASEEASKEISTEARLIVRNRRLARRELLVWD